MPQQDAAPRPPAGIGLIFGASSALAGHLVLFAIGAAFIWGSGFGLVVVVALVCGGALALVIGAGLLLLTTRSTRRLGTGLIVGSLIAGSFQIIGVFALLVAYSNANPGWDLS